MGTTEQWYEVLRHDGSKQYATKNEHGYFLYGTGRNIKKFDAVSVTPVESIPVEWQKGVCYVDESEQFQCFIDKNQYWNGWRCPFIFASEIDRFIKDMTCGDTVFLLDSEKRLIYKVEGEEDMVISPEPINGVLCYDLGSPGYCFDFDEA